MKSRKGIAVIGLGLFGLVCHSGAQNLQGYQESRSQSSAFKAISPPRAGSASGRASFRYSRTRKVAPSARTLTRYAIQILHEAEQVAQREPDPERRAEAL